MIPAAVRIGEWHPANLYPAHIDTSPGRYIERAYQAQFEFGTAPGPAGRYELTVAADTGFAHTDRGVPAALDNFDVVQVYWPDERRGDAAAADLRRRILGRTVYAFGGSLLSCGAEHKPEAFNVPLRVTGVRRDAGAAYWLETGATGHAYPSMFVAVDPIEVKANGCDPGFRFADPWQAGVSITTQPPPRGLAPDTPIVPGTSRNTVLWLLGYPDQFGSAQYFNALDGWYYAWPMGNSKSVSFAHDRVVRYKIASCSP